MISCSNLVPNAGRLMAEAGVALMPANYEFKGAWEYGAVPPEVE